MRYRLSEQWPKVTPTLEVTDEAGRVCYRAKAMGLALRDTITLEDAGGGAVAKLVAGWLGGYTVELGGTPAARVGGGPRPRIELLDGRGRLNVRGRPAGREVTLSLGRRPFAQISHKFFSLTDVYGVEAADPADDRLALAVAVALHRLTERS
jgi:uncharacterized protein YxjI